MSQSDQFDNYNGEEGRNDIVSDTYTAESRADIYNTPDVSINSVNEDFAEEAVGIVDEAVKAAEDEKTEEMAGTAGEDLRPAEMLTGEMAVEESNLYVGQSASNDDGQNSNLHDVQPASNNNLYSSQIVPNDNPYEGSPSGNYFYGGQAAQNNSQYYNDPNANNPYMGQNVQNGNVYGGQPAPNGNLYAGQYTQNGAPYTSQSVPNNHTYGNNPYTGQQTQGNYQYGSSTFTNNQYGNPPYGNNPYSPYAAPQKKGSTGLIIGIVVAVIILFLIALGALTYKAVTLYSEEKATRRNSREEYNFDDDWEKDRDRREDRYDNNDDNDYDYRYDDHHGGYNYDDNYGYDDYGYDDNYDYDDTYNYDDDEYYTLHDDIKENLSYSVYFDYYEYDTSYENVDIMIFYPVIEDADKSVPNVDKLNSTIQSEIDFLVEYFEDEYEDYFVDDEDGYFQATSTGYVTYMDEEKMSIVFSESIYSDYYYDAFLYSINIDMENGVILDNESMLNTNDDFSVEFRQKSDIQNGEISYLTRMSDQEITDHFNSSDIIVFYTPHG
ncbi:MAG: hypothetical protein NC416_15500, partial [Eubacterium sp.]|nr:hypothetical protein [Eubacterium sp.]